MCAIHAVRSIKGPVGINIPMALFGEHDDLFLLFHTMDDYSVIAKYCKVKKVWLVTNLAIN